MGTELQYALNLLSTSSKKHGDAVNVETAEFWACSRKRFLKDNLSTGFEQIQESMDRMLEQYNRESVKNTMIKQEEIFKEQVRELHRIYRVQKMLMAEMKVSSLANTVPGETRTGSDYLDMDTRTTFWSTSSSSPTNHSPFSNSQHNANQKSSSYDFHQRFKLRTGTSSQELTSCSRDTFRLQREFDLKQPAEEDISTNINVTEGQDPICQKSTKNKMNVDDPQCVHYCDHAESEIELTLSIGYNTDKKKQENQLHSDLKISCSKSTPDETRQLIPSTMFRSDGNEERSDTIVATSFERERMKQPQWLFQSLNLNRMRFPNT